MATVGVDILLKVNTGTEILPVWTIAGGQRGATLNMEGEGVDVTSKDLFGWSAELPGVNSWSIDFDGLYIENDAAFAELESAWRNRALIAVQIAMPGGILYNGKGRISLSIDAPYDDAATCSGNIVGYGELNKTAA